MRSALVEKKLNLGHVEPPQREKGSVTGDGANRFGHFGDGLGLTIPVGGDDHHAVAPKIARDELEEGK